MVPRFLLSRLLPLLITTIKALCHFWARVLKHLIAREKQLHYYYALFVSLYVREAAGFMELVRADVDCPSRLLSFGIFPISGLEFLEVEILHCRLQVLLK